MVLKWLLCHGWAILIAKHVILEAKGEVQSDVSQVTTKKCQKIPVEGAGSILSEVCPTEPSLDKAFAYWDTPELEKLHPNLFNEFCMRLPGNQINAGRVAPLYAFHVVLYKQEVYMSCCDPHVSCQRFLESGFRDHRDLREAIGVLQDLLTIFDMDMQFLLAFGDEPFTSKVLYSNVPLFHPSGSDAYWTIPWPSVYHIRALVQGLENDTLISKNPWQQKKPQLWWRGSMIAPSTTLLSTARFHPRMRLMKMAKNFPDLLNVAFSGVHQTLLTQWGEKNIDIILKEIHARFVEYEDFWEHAPKFKFLLVAPGVTQSHQLSYVLRSGSVPLIVSDVTFEHLFPLLLPWKHYVPIQGDLANLVPVLEQLLQDDDLAHRIAQAAQDLAIERLQPVGTYCYLSSALQKLQNLTGRQDHFLKKFSNAFTHIPLIDLAKENRRFLPIQERLKERRKVFFVCNMLTCLQWGFGF